MKELKNKNFEVWKLESKRKMFLKIKETKVLGSRLVNKSLECNATYRNKLFCSNSQGHKTHRHSIVRHLHQKK